jgi:hypothetical protein
MLFGAQAPADPNRWTLLPRGVKVTTLLRCSCWGWNMSLQNALRDIAAWAVERISWRGGAAVHDLTLCHPADKAAQRRPIITTRPFIGVLAVLLGSIISTLDSHHELRSRRCPRRRPCRLR